MSSSLKVVRIGRAWCLVSLLALCDGYAAGQSAPVDPFPNRSAADLLKAYRGGLGGSVQGQQYLFGVLNKGLPANDANLASVRSSLAKASANDDKILLMKVLASMYAPGVRSQANLSIESDIKKLIDSGDKRLATEAVLEYSRLGYPTDRYQVLRHARAAKIIDDDAYYGELAHGLRFSTPADQAQMLDELDSAHNSFGTEVLAATFGNPALLAQLSPGSQRRLLQVLAAREPNFPQALDSFGVVDTIRYAMWVNAVATIESTMTGKPYADLVVERLSDPTIDARKILALFGNPEGRRVISESKDARRLRILLGRAQGYSKTLPHNVMLNGAAAAFSQQMTQAGVAAGPPD